MVYTAKEAFLDAYSEESNVIDSIMVKVKEVAIQKGDRSLHLDYTDDIFYDWCNGPLTFGEAKEIKDVLERAGYKVTLKLGGMLIDWDFTPEWF